MKREYWIKVNDILRKLFPVHVRIENIFFIVVAVIVTVLLIVVMARTNEKHSAYECDVDSVIVTQGDTIWGIANKHCGGNIENAVYQISELNGGSSLQIGQRLVLP